MHEYINQKPCNRLFSRTERIPCSLFQNKECRGSGATRVSCEMGVLLVVVLVLVLVLVLFVLLFFCDFCGCSCF